MQFNSRWWPHLAFFVSTFITALTLQTFRALKNNYDISLQIEQALFFLAFQASKGKCEADVGGWGRAWSARHGKRNNIIASLSWRVYRLAIALACLKTRQNNAYTAGYYQ